MSPAPVRLLIVDDNEMIRQGVRELLARHEEYVVCGEAADGLEATEMALQLQPDIVLMDVSMPLMDGVEATRIIRRDLPQTDVIIVTQNDPVLVRQQVARIGAKALVSKDAIGRELIPTILSVVSDRKLDRSGTSTRYSVPPGVAEARKKIEGHEERRRSTRIAAEIGMWEWDPAKINQVLSPELFRIFGIDPEDPNHAATWASRVHPDDSERVQRLMESGYKSGALDFEYRYNHPELGLRWLYCKGARISGASRMFGLVQDVTEWRKAETALGESEQRFREMIDALPAAVYTTDAQGRLTHFNQAAVKLSGRVPNLGSDQWCVTWKLFRPDGSPLPHDQCPMAVALKEGRCVDGMEAIAERPDGKRVWFVPYPRVFRDADGRIVGGINMLVDITERKSAEQASGHLAAIVDSSDDAIVSKNLDGIITSWNRGAERIFGYTAEEIIGKPITTIIPLNRRDEETDILSRIRRGERVDHFETVRQRKDGSFIDVSVTISPMRDASGRIVGASKVARDVTDRRRAEERERAIAQAAVAATAKFRAIFEQTTVFAGIMTLDGILIEANKLSLEACGYRSEQVLGRPFWETPWWRDFRPSQEKIRAATPRVAEGVPYREFLQYSWADGTVRLVDFALYPIVDDEGHVLFLHPTGVDITDQKNAEENYRKLAESLDAEVRARTVELEERNVDVLRQSLLLRELSWQLLHIQDEERRRIARELHDSAGQILAVLGVNLATIVKKLRGNDPAIAEIAEEAQELAQQLTNEIRTTSYLLHPPLLDESGLSAALPWYVRGLTERSGLDISLKISENLGRFPREMELVIFRLVQECLTNIHRHSGSKSAAIQVIREPERVVVEVADQGKGISPERLAEIQTRGSGVGIRGMRERLRQFNGELTIDSNGAGTTVRVTIPVPKPAVEFVSDVQQDSAVRSAGYMA